MPNEDLLSFLRVARQLKDVKRTGWLDRGIPPEDAESVADHSWFVALAAWMLALEDPSLNASRVLELALIHDLAEAITGDTPPYAPEDIPDPADRDTFIAFFSQRRVGTPEQRADKAAQEEAAMARLLELLPPHSRETLQACWQEYETRATPEAHFVKDLDRFDAFFQARHYAETHPSAPVSGFTDMAMQAIETPTLKALRDRVLANESAAAVDLDLGGDDDGGVPGEAGVPRR